MTDSNPEPQQLGTTEDDFFVTAEQWERTTERVHGATGGYWYRSTSGKMAVGKPLQPSRGRKEPYREWIASRLARTLGVAVPKVELFATPEGPVSLSHRPGPEVRTYNEVFNDPAWAHIRDRARAAFRKHTGIIVLDVLLGGRDRSTNNIIYDEASDMWYSIDYAHCFAVDQAYGVGNSLTVHNQPYFQELIEALDSTEPIRSALRKAEVLTDTDIDRLCDRPGDFYCDNGERAQVKEYLKATRANIRARVNEWLRGRGKAPVTD